MLCSQHGWNAAISNLTHTEKLRCCWVTWNFQTRWLQYLKQCVATNCLLTFTCSFRSLEFRIQLQVTNYWHVLLTKTYIVKIYLCLWNVWNLVSCCLWMTVFCSGLFLWNKRSALKNGNDKPFWMWHVHGVWISSGFSLLLSTFTNCLPFLSPQSSHIMLQRSRAHVCALLPYYAL